MAVAGNLSAGALIVTRNGEERSYAAAKVAKRKPLAYWFATWSFRPQQRGEDPASAVGAILGTKTI